MVALQLIYLLAAVVALYGCVVFAYFHHRNARREELLHILTTAAGVGAPLSPALRAYLLDRPRGALREFWVAVILLFLLPGYYWIWHRRHRYDARVHQVIGLLDQGVPLHAALRATRGVASRETLLAAAVGESTGRLPEALRGVPRWRIAPVWLEVVPRLLYPVALLLLIFMIVSFLALYILPKFDKIHRDLGTELPALTKKLVEFIRAFIDLSWAVALALFGGCWLVIALILSPTLCWYFPGVSWLYRMYVRGRLLKVLGVLLEAGKTVPESLTILAGSGFFGGTVARKLALACYHVEHGEPLASSLQRTGLLPGAMVPLVQAAERGRNLPWALAELGDHLTGRAARLLQRLSLLFFPISVAVIGLLVAFVVLAMFLPLLKMMEVVGQ